MGRFSPLQLSNDVSCIICNTFAYLDCKTSASPHELPHSSEANTEKADRIKYRCSRHSDSLVVFLS